MESNARGMEGQTLTEAENARTLAERAEGGSGYTTEHASRKGVDGRGGPCFVGNNGGVNMNFGGKKTGREALARMPSQWLRKTKGGIADFKKVCFHFLALSAVNERKEGLKAKRSKEEKSKEWRKTECAKPAQDSAARFWIRKLEGMPLGSEIGEEEEEKEGRC